MDPRDIPLRNRKTWNGAAPVTRQEWGDCHSDYKSTPNSPTHPGMLAMDENGVTCCYRVVIMSASFIEEKRCNR